MKKPSAKKSDVKPSLKAGGHDVKGIVKKKGRKANMKISKAILKKGAVAVSESVKNGLTKLKRGRKKAREYVDPVLLNRGVVYLSHIPHGFYEDQMKEYFGQFGKVTGINMPRSKSGKSRGYAFIEFFEPEVAKVAAETMNNYLMFNRLLKTKYIPPEEQKPTMFKPKKVRKDMAELARKIDLNRKSRPLSKEKNEKFVEKTKKKLTGLHKRLQALGIDYEFQVDESEAVLTGVKPVDPEEEAEPDENKQLVPVKQQPFRNGKTLLTENKLRVRKAIKNTVKTIKKNKVNVEAKTMKLTKKLRKEPASDKKPLRKISTNVNRKLETDV